MITFRSFFSVFALALVGCFSQLQAAHYKVFVLTGQSNSLGTTNGAEADVSPGVDVADAQVRFFWSNVADASTSLGDSGGVFKDLQVQQGGHYAGSATHWGPEISFGRSLVRGGVENVAIVKASRGGGGNTNWSKADSGHMYSQVVNTVNAAAAAMTSNGDTFEIVALLYVQGESDSAAEAAIAGTRFKGLVDNLRTDLPNAADMRGIIGGIAAAGGDRDTVRVKQAEIAASTEYIQFFSNLDLQNSVVSDNLHFNKAAKLLIGERFAEATGLVTLPPAHIEGSSSDFSTRYEGNQIWNGTNLINGWSQVNNPTLSLSGADDLRMKNQGASWLEGTNAGWKEVCSGPWTMETRVKFDANANGFVIWLGAGSARAGVEIYGDRTQNMEGGTRYNVAHNNVDGQFHTFRIVNDPLRARYHVFRDGERITPLEGVIYDANGAEQRLIFGDYTSNAFGNGYDATLDYVRFAPEMLLPEGLDTDANGLPDAWEYEYFSTLIGTDPDADPDGDGYSNLEEFQNGTNPLVADAGGEARFPVFIFAGEGNALGLPGVRPPYYTDFGTHPAEQAGGIAYHDGNGWTSLDTQAVPGPEVGFSRMLWDAGIRNFGIVKNARAAGGNTLWQEGNAAYQDLLAAAQAASTPPTGYDSVVFRALVFLQGESNDASEAAAVGSRFTAMLAALRSELSGAATMQAILGENGGSNANQNATRSALIALANGNSNIGIASAAGLVVQDDDGLGSHYTADSLYVLGARLAAESLAMGLHGSRPLPAWGNLHAWYVADHAVGFGNDGSVNRWSDLRNGSAVRDLTRSLGGSEALYSSPVTAQGTPRQTLRFSGSSNLWANATNEFGTINGARTVAVLCRLMGAGNGFLFDGTTHTGRTRAQVRNGSWQAGVTPQGASVSWDLAEPTTAAISSDWQRHVFIYVHSGGSTTIQHWIDGVLVATVSESETATLGGLILGANGGSPSRPLSVEIAEVAVYDKALNVGEVAALDAAWDASWGSPTGPPFSVRVAQDSREIARFGSHEVLEIVVTSEEDDINTLEDISFDLRGGGNVEKWLVFTGNRFFSNVAPLAEVSGEVATWSPSLGVSLAAGVNRFYLVAIPERLAALGSEIDAAVSSITFSGEQAGSVIPSNADPVGELTLALVPYFTDVVAEGDESGIPHFRIPGIVSDKNGVLHAVYDHRYINTGNFEGGNDLPADIDVGYSRSTDGGATWTPTVAIMDFDSSVPGSEGNGVGDPCILYDPNTDTIWVAATWSFGNRAYNGSGPGLEPSETAQYMLTKSTDGGETWSDLINITKSVKDPAWRLIFQGPGHGLVMRDGTLVFPSQRRDANGTVQVCSVYSDDQGESWHFGSVVPTSSPETNENTVCELDDGRLLFSMRTPSGWNGERAWIYYTPGGAKPMEDGSWSELFRLPSVPDSVCQGSVLQWTSVHEGDPRELVIFGNPASSTRARVDFTLRASADGGASWPVSRLLYLGSSGYSSICVLPDKSIGVLFERDYISRMTFARVEAEWLMNPEVDTDGDGMPDAWEVLHGLDPNVDDAEIDSDGDGVSNIDEYRAGTDPMDAASKFTILRPELEDGELYLAWESVPGRYYYVEESEDLVNWVPVEGGAGILAEGGFTEFSVMDHGEERRFFRVRTGR